MQFLEALFSLLILMTISKSETDSANKPFFFSSRIEVY